MHTNNTDNTANTDAEMIYTVRAKHDLSASLLQIISSRPVSSHGDPSERLHHRPRLAPHLSFPPVLSREAAGSGR